MKQPKILLMDDDEDLVAELTGAFTAVGMDARGVGDFAGAMEIVETWQPDLIVLDQRLGTVDTLLMVPELRAATSVPIVILTGNRDEADRIIGLELGADDFLVKPIARRELVARVRAHLRRASRDEAAGGAKAGDAAEGKAAAWQMDRVSRRLFRPSGEAVPLTMLEFELLAKLAETPGEPFDRDVLMRDIMSRPHWAQDRSLDNLVHRIRRKIGRGEGGEVISSIRNKGYAFRGFPAE